MICIKCGANIPEGSKACPFCGNPVQMNPNQARAQWQNQTAAGPSVTYEINNEKSSLLDGCGHFLAAYGMYLLFSQILSMLYTLMIGGAFGSVFVAANSMVNQLVSGLFFIVLFTEGLIVVCTKGSPAGSRIALGVGAGILITGCMAMTLFSRSFLLSLARTSHDIIGYAMTVLNIRILTMLAGAVIATLLGFLLPGRSLTVKITAIYGAFAVAWVLMILGMAVKVPAVIYSGDGLLMAFGLLTPCWAGIRPKVQKPVKGGYVALSILLPLVGLILFIVKRHKDYAASRSAGIGAIIGAVMSVLNICLFIFQFIVALTF